MQSDRSATNHIRREPFVNLARSAAAKPQLPLLHERLRRFPVVFCQALMDVVCDLEVHAFLEVAVDRPVQVLFHVAVGNRRTLGQPPARSITSFSSPPAGKTALTKPSFSASSAVSRSEK